MNRYSPIRVVTVTVSAVFGGHPAILDDEELADIAIEALADALPDGFHFNSSSAHVASVAVSPED